MMTLEAFRLEYPEFQSAPDAFVQKYLDKAAKQIDPAIWGEKADQGHGKLTAHLMAISPSGQMSRLVAKDGTTTYGQEYERLLYAVTCGLRVF